MIIPALDSSFTLRLSAFLELVLVLVLVLVLDETVLVLDCAQLDENVRCFRRERPLMIRY